jgi:hypothetical protein
VFIAEIFIAQDRKHELYYSADGDINNRYSLIYTDSAVTVTGSYTDTDEGVTHTTIAALDLKQGWNYMKISFVDDDLGFQRQMRYETIRPGNDAKWVVPIWDSNEDDE